MRSMADFETRIARAKHLLANEHTLRYLHSYEVSPVRQTTIDALACMLCKQARGVEASTRTIPGSECAPVGVVEFIGKRFTDLGILTREKIPREPGEGGKSRYNYGLSVSVPSAVRVELHNNRPCQRKNVG